MVRRSLLGAVYPVLLIFIIFLYSACAKKTSTLTLEGAQKSDSSKYDGYKAKTDRLIGQEKEAGDSAKSLAESSMKRGNCIYGCKDTDQVDKKNMMDLSASAAYLLGPEDVIEVTVWKNENLSRIVLIRPDGRISLPLIGDVQAAGLTSNQLKESIKEKLKEYKENPDVSVIVKEINSLVIYVTGEVAHPGRFSLKSDISVLQAIVLAGGFTQFASPNSIVLLRRIEGIETRRVIRYKDIVTGRNPDADVLLQRGDTIVVP